MFKNMRLVTLFDMLLNLKNNDKCGQLICYNFPPIGFKMTTSVANIARAAASASKFIY